MPRLSLFFLLVAVSSIMAGPGFANGPHEYGETGSPFGGFAHLPTVVWIILLGVLGLLVMAIVVVIVAKPQKKKE